MEFTFETVYDQKAMTALVRGIRKVLRKKQSKRTKCFGSLAIFLGLLLLFSAEAITFRIAVTLGIVMIILLAMIFQDQINGYIARKRILPGMETTMVTFHENGYHSVTAVGESDFPYSVIQCVIDTGEYFVLAFGPSHGQVYSKQSIRGGTTEDFLSFLTVKTGKTIEKV